MKIQLVSDLHLEFDYREIKNAGADVLVLGGDICVVNYLMKSSTSPSNYKGDEFRYFFDEVSKNFDQVLYIPGNHEHYKGLFQETVPNLRANVPDNIQILDSEFVDIDGYRFIGGTLWTDFNKSPIAESAAESRMNDFKLIKWRRGTTYHKFRTTDSIVEHYAFLDIIDKNLKSNTIVLSHHAPSYRSVSTQYRTERYAELNHAYFSHLDEFIEARPAIKLWTHGHVHSNHDYMIGNTRIVCNPAGYGCENIRFDPQLIIEV